MAPLAQLEESIHSIRYPDGVIAVPGPYCPVPGQGFYPGGRGYRNASFPLGKVMYLGHNFDKLRGLRESVARGYEENLTWRRIRDSIFPYLPEEHIWFTNYFMGVLVRDTNIGEITRTSTFAHFEEDCWNFFKLQVSLQKPRVIVALGKEVVRVLYPHNRLNIPSWQLGPSDTYGHLRLEAHDASIKSIEGDEHRFKLVAAYHPSFGRSAPQIATLIEDSKFIASLLKH
jgi:hypothetical protein